MGISRQFLPLWFIHLVAITYALYEAWDIGYKWANGYGQKQNIYKEKQLL